MNTTKPSCAISTGANAIAKVPTGMTFSLSKNNNINSGKDAAADGDEKEVEAEEEEDDDPDDDDSVPSIHQTHGTWKDEPMDQAWNGCVCGDIHARPIPVFWMHCEGPCQAWFNVTSSCVQGVTATTAEHVVWQCPKCLAQRKRQSAAFLLFWELPPDVLYRILEFAERPTFRAGILQAQLGSLNQLSRHFVQGEKTRGLWQTMLTNEYQMPPQPLSKTSNIKSETTVTKRRCSQRQRKSTNFLSPTLSTIPSMDARQTVRHHHEALLQRTEDVYHAIEELADPFNAYNRRSKLANNTKHLPSLTLNRLRHVLQKNQPLDVNRPSPCTGRTLLQVVCAGEMSEGVIVACVEHLLRHYQADPNVFSRQEEPYANRPAIYFAIARAMPNLVQMLVQTGASLTTSVQGKFKLTFDTTREMNGTYTPCQYAQAMREEEILNARQPNLVSAYWEAKLKNMIQLLDKATEDAKQQGKRWEGFQEIKGAKTTARAKRAASRKKCSAESSKRSKA